jgi:hypothetical protein
MGKFSIAAAGLLAMWLLTGCNKLALLGHMNSGAVATHGDHSQTNLVVMDLGVLNLTNNEETSVSIGTGRACMIAPRMIDRKNMQLTLTVESKNTRGKIMDLSITQGLAASGKPFEAAVGGFNFSLTPRIATE